MCVHAFKLHKKETLAETLMWVFVKSLFALVLCSRLLSGSVWPPVCNRTLMLLFCARCESPFWFLNIIFFFSKENKGQVINSADTFAVADKEINLVALNLKAYFATFQPGPCHRGLGNVHNVLKCPPCRQLLELPVYLPAKNQHKMTCFMLSCEFLITVQTDSSRHCLHEVCLFTVHLHSFPTLWWHKSIPLKHYTC